MATLRTQRILMDAVPDTEFHPWGVPACVVLPDGGVAVAVAYINNVVGKIRVYHLAPDDLTTRGVIDIDWESAGLGYPFMVALEDRTVMMVVGPENQGNPGLTYLLDFSGADPVVQASYATAFPPLGGWYGYPAGVIYLREHAIAVLVTQTHVTTYRHGSLIDALDISSYWNEVIGVWPNPDDSSKFAVDFYGDPVVTYEYTVDQDGYLTGAAMTLPTLSSTWWPLATSSPYEPDSVVLNSTSDTYEVTARDGTVLYSATLTGYVLATGVLAPHTLGMVDAKRLVLVCGHIQGDWPSEVASRLVEIDYGDQTIDIHSPDHGATPVNVRYDLTIAGSSAIHHRDGKVAVVGTYVDSGATNYFALVAWLYDAGVRYPFVVKDGDGNWHKVGDGESADGGRLALKTEQGWFQELRTPDGESMLYPLKLKVADDRWETVAMLTSGEAV